MFLKPDSIRRVKYVLPTDRQLLTRGVQGVEGMEDCQQFAFYVSEMCCHNDTRHHEPRDSFQREISSEPGSRGFSLVSLFSTIVFMTAKSVTHATKKLLKFHSRENKILKKWTIPCRTSFFPSLVRPYRETIKYVAWTAVFWRCMSVLLSASDNNKFFSPEA